MVALAPTAPRLGRFVTIWLHHAPGYRWCGVVFRIVQTKYGTGYQLRWQDGKVGPLIMAHWIRRTKVHPNTESPTRTETT